MYSNDVIPIEKLPFNQFKLLGMEKKEVLALPPATINALLSGNRTSLIQFNNIQLNSLVDPFTLNARLSLYKDGDAIKLKMYPVQLSEKNPFNLSQPEIDFLKKDPLNVLPKMVVGKEGKLTDSFVSLDKLTNEFIAVKRDSINAPDSINNIYLTDEQKRDFVNGKPIQIADEKYQLDVNSEEGISGKKLDRVQFKSGTYNTYNFLADAALILSGLSVLVLVEHLAKMVFNNKEQAHELLKKDLNPVLHKTLETIHNKAQDGMEMSSVEKSNLLVNNIKEYLHVSNEEKMEEKPKTNIDQNATIGELQEHIKKDVGIATKAIEISTMDAIKIACPQQRNVGESITELKDDKNKQLTVAENAGSNITSALSAISLIAAVKETPKITRGLKR